MKATAIKIPQTEKERIDIDGATAIKSAVLGRWNFVAIVKYDGNMQKGTVLKSETKAGIERLVSRFPVDVVSFEIAEIER